MTKQWPFKILNSITTLAISISLNNKNWRPLDFFQGGEHFFPEKNLTFFSRRPQNTGVDGNWYCIKHFTTFPAGASAPLPLPIRASMPTNNVK